MRRLHERTWFTAIVGRVLSPREEARVRYPGGCYIQVDQKVDRMEPDYLFNSGEIDELMELPQFYYSPMQARRSSRYRLHMLPCRRYARGSDVCTNGPGSKRLSTEFIATGGSQSSVLRMMLNTSGASSVHERGRESIIYVILMEPVTSQRAMQPRYKHRPDIAISRNQKATAS